MSSQKKLQVARKTVTTRATKKVSAKSVPETDAWQESEEEALAREAEQDKLCEVGLCDHFLDDPDNDMALEVDKGRSSPPFNINRLALPAPDNRSFTLGACTADILYD